MTAGPAAPGAGAPPGDPAGAFRRADLLVELRRPQEAVDLLRDTLTVHPGRADLWGQLAMALLAAERYGEAYEAAAARIRLAPESEWGYRLASLALSGQGRRGEATQAAQESVRLAPMEWRSHARLARAVADEGRFQEGWPAALRAAELAPDEPEAHMTVGSVAVSLRDWRQAEAAYRQVLALDPANAAARNNLALATLHRGEVAGATAGFADAVATDPSVEVARRNLEVALRITASRLLRIQLALALLLLYLAASTAGRPATVVVAAGAAGLAGYLRLRWQLLPASVRRYARSLVRTRWRFRALAALAPAGFAALAAAVVLGTAGLPLGARIAAGLAAVATLAGWACSVRR